MAKYEFVFEINGKKVGTCAAIHGLDDLGTDGTDASKAGKYIDYKLTDVLVSSVQAHGSNRSASYKMNPNRSASYKLNPNRIQSNQATSPIGLLLPAVQKVRESGASAGSKGTPTFGFEKTF